jgi:anti-sigma-K factor RskA
MNEKNHIELEDLALFAMQLLPAEETANIHEHLLECAECRQSVCEVQGDLAAFALTAEMHSPPAAARQRLFTQIARERKVVPIEIVERAQLDDPDLPARRRTFLVEGDEDQTKRLVGAKVLPWIGWAGWAVAAGVALTTVSFYQQRNELRSTILQQSGQIASLNAEADKGRSLIQAMTDQSAMRVTLTQTPEKPVPQGRATYVPEKGTLLFTASNMEPLQPYKTYELWIIPADGHDPIPAGTFHPDERGNASVIMPEIPKGVLAKAFGVTIEDEGGSSTPTKPVIMAGA